MIETFTSGMDFEAFREDPKTVAAVERELQIVSEAAVRLGPNAERRCPGLPWRDKRDRELASPPVRADRAVNHLENSADRSTAPQGRRTPGNKSASFEPSRPIAEMTRRKS